ARRLALVERELGEGMPGDTAGGERERSLLGEGKRLGCPPACERERASVELHARRKPARAAMDQRIEQRIGREWRVRKVTGRPWSARPRFLCHRSDSPRPRARRSRSHTRGSPPAREPGPGKPATYDQR